MKPTFEKHQKEQIKTKNPYWIANSKLKVLLVPYCTHKMCSTYELTSDLNAKGLFLPSQLSDFHC